MKSSRYRISDNYIRFYLRCIAPVVDKINQGIIDANGIEANQNWQARLGLQFENLVYANLSSVIAALKIDPRGIVSCSPYVQRKTSKNKGACQIDLAILTKYDVLYLCEIKFRRKIENSVAAEVAKKISLLQRKKHISVQPVLLYAGELDEELTDNDFFYQKVNFADFLTSS